MNRQIEQELERIVGGAGVEVSESETSSEANRRVRLEMTDAVYDLPANRLLIVLEKVPDRIGVPALRKVIEEHFPSVIENP